MRDFHKSQTYSCNIFFDKTRVEQLTAMLAGNPFFHIHGYEKEEEIYPLIDMLLQS